ncbi:hypothetical protein Q0F99_07725 [Rathayibacter oskolensis]|uniref:hypothetical protein n=1 Tax=Rathayibacter TaxID=33886 RepID=UPI001316D913|nr:MULTISPECIES: hypothetical protein [Rathayibacter]QHC68303.1 hypothetical protein GSU68_18170 [Rathayibacter sp. VKM Ac-2759]WKK72783.1 hypothetical protein Q0F99_07725 [Rathayibacter oskolensis]
MLDVEGAVMVQITVQDKTYLLDAGTSMDEAKQAVLDAMRAAPAFLSLRTVLGGHVEILLTPTSSVVLEEHDEAPLPLPAHVAAELDYDDLYGLDYA